MGEADLKSHKRNTKHTELLSKSSSNLKISEWVKSCPSSVPNQLLKSCTLEDSVITNDAMKAEI